MSVSVAFRAFFATLFNNEVAERVQIALSPDSLPALSDESSAQPEVVVETKKTSKEREKPRQNEAITLLAALQREARFVDFVQEPLAGFSDAQIGAAARTVHDDCAKVLQRFFELKPVVEQPEESQVEITSENLPLFQLAGNVSQAPPMSGKLVHAGWKATKTELPTWTGQQDTALIVAPAEAEL